MRNRRFKRNFVYCSINKGNMKLEVGQIVKINKNLTRHNIIAHSLKKGDIVKIIEIDLIKQRAIIEDDRGNWSIKLTALDSI